MEGRASGKKSESPFTDLSSHSSVIIISELTQILKGFKFTSIQSAFLPYTFVIIFSDNRLL